MSLFCAFWHFFCKKPFWHARKYKKLIFKPFVDFGFKKESLSDIAHIFERANKKRRASAQSQRARKIEKPIKLINSPRSDVRSGKV